jgi:hypothetical protein
MITVTLTRVAQRDGRNASNHRQRCSARARVCVCGRAGGGGGGGHTFVLLYKLHGFLSTLLDGRHSSRRFGGSFLCLCSSTRLLFKPLLCSNPRILFPANLLLGLLLPAAFSGFGGSDLLIRTTLHLCCFFLFETPLLCSLFLDTATFGIDKASFGIDAAALSLGSLQLARGVMHSPVQ